MKEREEASPRNTSAGVRGRGKSGREQGERNNMAAVHPGRVAGGEERKKEKRRDAVQR